MKPYDLIVIGGGPAGLMAALQAQPASVLVLEKMSRSTIKLMLSGSRQCNFTHDGPVDQFFSHYGKSSNFVKHALKNFSNRDLIDFFEQRHIKCTVTDHGKVFPQSMRAHDICNALIDECHKQGITIATREPVQNVEILPSGRFRCVTQNGQHTCRYLVIATGGVSYPKTGSSGDGYRMAQSLGHNIVTPKPALAPVEVLNYQFAEMAGISLSGITVSVWRGDKKMSETRGDILFTHTGLSGPGILNLSRYLQAGDTVKIDLAGDMCSSPSEFTDILQKSSNQQISSVVRSMDIPRQLAGAIVEMAGLKPSDPVHSVRKDNRKRLFGLLCGLPFVVKATGGFDVAIVTSGGVDKTEIAARTMQSKLLSNLFFAGEVIDIDGDEGGYNLQFAFSSGALAGSSIAKLLASKDNIRTQESL